MPCNTKRPFGFTASVTDKHGKVHTAECIAARPSWESVHRWYKMEQHLMHNEIRSLPISGTARVSFALNLASNWGGSVLDDAKELVMHLSKDEVWGRADMEILVPNNNGLTDVKKRMLDGCINNRVYHGVYIIMKTNGSGHASLWIGDEEDTIDKNNNINGGDAVYFWGLKRAQYDFDEMARILRAIKATNMNQAAIKGFKVINELSRNAHNTINMPVTTRITGPVEVGANIYRNVTTNMFSLDDVSIGDTSEVRMAAGSHGREAVAFIHTHIARVVEEVGRRENSYFLSGVDFNAANSNRIYVYMKHIEKDRILKATPHGGSELLNFDLDNYGLKRNNGMEVIISDCYRKEECYSSQILRNGDNRCQEANRDIQEMLNNRRSETGDVEVINRIDILLNSIVGIDDCWFGIYKKHGQKVFEVNLKTGGERRL